MKTETLPSAINGHNETCTQVFNGVANTGAPQLVSLVIRRAKRYLLLFAMLLAIMLGFIQESIGQGSTTFNNGLSGTDQSFTFTVPPGVTSITVQAWGGGGGGGGNSNNANGGGGGGGGAYSSSTITGLTPGTDYTVNVGKSGTTTYGSAGGPGGDSWFGAAITVMAKGGTGGGAATSSSGGTAGVGGASGTGFGITKYSGGSGGAGRTNGTGTGGGGGSSAGTGANGNNGVAGGTSAGAGGTAPAGGGSGGAGGAANGNGVAGSTPGGAGGGSGDHDPSGGNGGAGAAGRVTITWTIITITGFSPTETCPGKTLTITGTNFTGATAVKFNGVSAITYTVNNANQITATLPSGATTGLISVTTPDGTGSSSSNFTVTSLKASSIIKNVSCYGGTDGEITVTAIGGIAPYYFSKDNGGLYDAGSNPHTFTGLSVGPQYKIRVKDANGCESPALQ